MKPRPLVSVLLPVRDAAPWLQAALDSLARQTFADFEVVAVDDGSTDGSGELLAARAGADPRFRVLRQSRRGVVPALNRGLARCRGEWVARMDADDVAHARRLELQVHALTADPSLDAVCSLVRFFPCTAVERGLRLYETWLNGLVTHEEILRERFVECPVPNPTGTVRRRLLECLGGWREGPPGGSGEDPGERWPEDYDQWLRLAAAGARLAKVRRVLHFWREHPERATHTDPRYGKDRFLACKAHHLAQGPLAESLTGTRGVVIWGAGPTGRRMARELERRGVEIRAFVDIDPGKVGRQVRGREVVAPAALPERLGAGTVVLAAVAARGARDPVRRALNRLGLVEGEGYWCVA